MRVTVRRHIRKRKNGASVVRQHTKAKSKRGAHLKAYAAKPKPKVQLEIITKNNEEDERAKTRTGPVVNASEIEAAKKAARAAAVGGQPKYKREADGRLLRVGGYGSPGEKVQKQPAAKVATPGKKVQAERKRRRINIPNFLFNTSLAQQAIGGIQRGIQKVKGLGRL